jgi:hypothetical protein
MTNLIDAAQAAAALLAKEGATPEDLEQARALLQTIVEAERIPRLGWIHEDARKALMTVEQEQALYPYFVEEEGKRVAYASDTSRWVYGLPDEPGMYWFVVPYVRKFASYGSFTGQYFGKGRSLKLDGWGKVDEADLENAWHQPIFVPEIPESIVCRARSRGTLDRALTRADLFRVEAN